MCSSISNHNGELLGFAVPCVGDDTKP